MTSDHRNSPPTSVPSGFRPRSRRRTRVAAGAAVAALAVIGNVAIYTSLDHSTDVIQFTSNVYAGDLIEPDDVRVVAVDADLVATNLVPADRAVAIVGRYARTFIPARSLASEVMVRSSPLVSPGTAVVAIEPTGGLLPRGITERSRIWLVIEASDGDLIVDARVVALDRDGGDGAVSVEVAEADAPTVASADAVHVVLLDPGLDATTATARGGDG